MIQGVHIASQTAESKSFMPTTIADMVYHHCRGTPVSVRQRHAEDKHQSHVSDHVSAVVRHVLTEQNKAFPRTVTSYKESVCL